MERRMLSSDRLGAPVRAVDGVRPWIVASAVASLSLALAAPGAVADPLAVTLGASSSGESATAADAAATRVVVRVVSRGAKTIGSSVGGARVWVRDPDTGEVLAEGIQRGSTGDTDAIMRDPHRTGETVEIRSRVTMLCGCPITEGGLWDAGKTRVRAEVRQDGEVRATVPLEYAGEPDLFGAARPARELGLEPGAFEVVVLAVRPGEANTGVGRIVATFHD